MSDAVTQQPAPSSEPKTYGSGTEGAREAARELTKRREPDIDNTAVKDFVTGKTHDTVELGDLPKTRSGNTDTHAAAKLLGDYHRQRDGAIAEYLAPGSKAATEAAAAEAAAIERGETIETEDETPGKKSAPSHESPAAIEAEKRAVERERAATEAHQAATVERQAFNTILEQGVKFALQSYMTQFPDAVTPQQLEELRTSNPARFVEANTALDKIRAGANQVAAIAQHQTAQERAAFASYAKEQDAIFEQSLPEAKDPRAYRAFRESAYAYGKDGLGLSDEQLSHLWNTDRNFRGAIGQRLFADGTRWWMVQQRARTATPKAPPPVQRPGVSQPGRAHASQVSAAAEKFAKSGNLRDAAALLSAKRRAAQRNSGGGWR